MRFPTVQKLMTMLGLLLWADCGSTPTPSACNMKCMAMSSDAKDQVCGTDGKTYAKCDLDCGAVPTGVGTYPGACVAGNPPADGPPAPADGVKICDWVKVGTQWNAVECASNIKGVTGDMPQTLDGQSANGSMGMQMPLPPSMQPDSVDHRVRFGPAKNQGTAGTCTAFGAIATVEGMIRSQLNTPISLSEMHLWSRYRSPGSDASVQAVKKGGVATTAAAVAAGLPYDATLAADWELDEKTMMSKKTPDAALISGLDGQGQYQVASVDVLPGTVANGANDMVPSVDMLKTALAEGNDITVALFTSDEFVSPPLGGVIADWTFAAAGGHAVSLVGYRTVDGKLQFLLRNSWGTWAESGYAWIPSATLQKNLLHAFIVSVKRVGVDTAPTCPAGQAADLSGVCRMVCPDGSVADSTNTCKAQMTTCANGQVADSTGSCVAACMAGPVNGTGYMASCTNRGCTWHVNDGVMGCTAGAGKTCDKFCPAPSCQVTTTKNEFGKPIWGCTGHNF